MNSYATLMFVYTLFTLISSSILCASFRKKFDASARYFLTSELLMGTTCTTLLLINLNIINPFNWARLAIFSAIAAEIAILFSLLTLHKKIEQKWFFLSIAVVVLITLGIEALRSNTHPQTVILVISLCLTCAFIVNYLTCRFLLTTSLGKNQFIKWFTWLELGMIGYGVIRIVGYFSPTPITPWGTPNVASLIIFSFYMVIGTFRYVSYIGLRTTWVNEVTSTQNSLNKTISFAIEEKSQLLKSLIASNRVIAISALASSLAHQLSQPLTTIALRLDTVRRDLEKGTTNSQTLQSLDEISFQSKNLAELIKNLRQLFTSKNQQLAPISLQKITDEIIEIIKPTLDAKKITLLKKYENDQIVYGNSIQLQQVIINVFNNAIDALDQSFTESKSISTRIATNGKYALIEISDNGGGINEKIVPEIFNLYKTTKSSGLGVGLWLSKTILEQHQGDISVLTDGNSYSIFTIQIPIDKEIESLE